MTITYANGIRVEGIVLARTEQWIRVAIRGCRDSAEFVAGPSGSWISESGDAVRLGDPLPQAEAPDSLDDFLCPQDLIARLVGGPEVVVGYPCVAVM